MFSFAHTETATEYFRNLKNIEYLVREGLTPEEPSDSQIKLLPTENILRKLPKNLELIPNYSFEKFSKVLTYLMSISLIFYNVYIISKNSFFTF